MRIVFLGSGAFAVPGLEALLGAGHEVVAVVTQPDRAKGRGQALAPPPVKPAAEARGLPVLQVNRVRAPEAQAALRAFAPELQVVIAFGQILPRSVIDIAPHGTVNVHGSLLPKLRGAAPVQWAIANGDTTTGVTTMLIDEGLDTGPILLKRSLDIGPEETAAELTPRLARLGAELLVETVAGLAGGTIVPVPQDPAQATHAPILEKEDGRIDWSRSAAEIANRGRAFAPWPGAFTTHGGCLLKVLKSRALSGRAAPEAAAPGEVLDASRAGVHVVCGGGTLLEVVEVQPESRRAMAAFAWATGARVAAGSRFD